VFRGRKKGVPGMSSEKEIVIVAYVNHVDCPHCDASQMGFVNDPRGGDYVCEDCKKPYHIPSNAPVDFG
jgi:transposase-like protein